MASPPRKVKKRYVSVAKIGRTKTLAESRDVRKHKDVRIRIAKVLSNLGELAIYGTSARLHQCTSRCHAVIL